MKLEQYQELAPKTLNDKGYEINCLHMALGMAGELEEIFEAANEYFTIDNDVFKRALLEEGTDIKWFVVVLGSLKGVQFNTKRLADEPAQLPKHTMLHQDIRNLVHHVLTLTDVVKREICYGKAKYQGVEVTPEKYEQLMYKTLSSVDQMFAKHGLDPEIGYDLNIQKLHKVRYKDGFSTETATNRDLDAEKALIHGNVAYDTLVEKVSEAMFGPEDEENELDTELCSDGGNSYNVPKYKVSAFNRDVEHLQKLYEDGIDDDSSAYYAGCETFDSVWGEYKI